MPRYKSLAQKLAQTVGGDLQGFKVTGLRAEGIDAQQMLRIAWRGGSIYRLRQALRKWRIEPGAFRHML